MLMDKQEEKQLNPPPHSSSPTSSSSPSHEFSFTISLHPSAATNTNPPEKNNKAPPPPFAAAIDLSPADHIFFHGHLLPLHLLSHLSAISPRSSTNSLDSFTLPIKELSKENNNTSSNIHHQESILLEGKPKPSEKPKIPFSLFGLPRWIKGDNHNQEHNTKHKPKPKPKSRFDLMQRYMRLIKPFLVSFRSSNNGRGNNSTNQNFSFSGGGDVKAVRSKKSLLKRGRRGEYSSAPASMRTSPTNSGLLVQGGGGGGGSSGNITPTYNKSDSTMDELQAAIQAAIAHCKKSISTEPDH